jgi:hypothetical protein
MKTLSNCARNTLLVSYNFWFEGDILFQIERSEEK